MNLLAAVVVEVGLEIADFSNIHKVLKPKNCCDIVKKIMISQV
jgi:hypothetical protein